MHFNLALSLQYAIASKGFADKVQLFLFLFSSNLGLLEENCSL